MRRDQFAVTVWDGTPPTAAVTYDGPSDELEERLEAVDLEDCNVDASFRLLGPLEEDAEGVFALTDRLTGEYLFEAEADAGELLELVEQVDGGDGESRYQVRIRHDETITCELDGLFVYDQNGELLRSRSLIPGGVEL